MLSGRSRSPSRITAAERGCLAIADISGYTDYLVASPLEHAEDVLADVTSTVVKRLEPVLRVNKLEGDAAFCYALEGEIDASLLLDAIEECYFAFRARLRGIEHSTSCDCAACAKLPELNLKFIVHWGDFIRRATPTGEELTGQDVILVHRLLKNTVGDALGFPAYALFTAASVEALGLTPATLGLFEHQESYADIGETDLWVENLEGRWQEERERRRTFVPREAAAFEVEARVEASPAVVWEWLTAPTRRMLWQAASVDETSPAGRRGAGTTSFCIDGRREVYEEILDWRPFTYFTERKTFSGNVELVITTELEPAGAGTIVRTRGGRLEGRDRLLWLAVGRRARRDLQAGYKRLAGFLEPRFSTSTRLPVL